MKIAFPPDAKKAHPNGFDMALANFGSPKYGGSLMGRLIYVDKDYHEDYICSPPCRFACQDFASATPKLDLRSQSKETYIMMVDRGPNQPGLEPCKFAQKVWNAQNAGAKGVVVVNYEDRMTTMEAPDEDDEANHKYLTNITVPASFIKRSDGDVLKGLLKSGQQVYVTLDWTDALPKKQQVSWEFWTNSNDQCGPICDVQKEFIKDFVPVAKEFDEKGWTRFTPHYIIWICPSPYGTSDECSAQCIHNGRYCSPDPDGNLKEGYSGADVVQENLRQLCVFKLANDSGKPWLWWDYVTRFGEQCDMDSKKYGQECAEHVFGQINSDGWSSVDKLRECIGDRNSDRDHPIMEQQLLAQKGDDQEGEVFILPTIRINGVQYRHVGGRGYNDCISRKDGKTQTCLDINECLSISQLDANCTCERCACKNTYGGYECITNIPNECANDYGGCWHADMKIAGKQISFSGCRDNIKDYRDALSHNKPVERSGKVTCERKCDLEQCDLDMGICHLPPGSGKSGLGAGGIVGIVLLCCVVVALGGYAAYRLRLRGMMQAEVRAIMAQYMELPGDDKMGGEMRRVENGS
eukprot:scaffold14.g1340.t1